MPSGDNLIINNDSGNFRFSGNANLDSVSNKINLQSNSIFKVNAANDILLNTDSGNTKLINESKSIILDGQSTNSNAIEIKATNAAGGINIDAGSQGLDIDATGNVDIFSQGSHINIGVPPAGTSAENMTQTINLESNNNIVLSSEDISLVGTDLVSLISITGNIQLGSDTNNPVMKFEKGNFLINQFSSTLDRQLDVAVKDESTSKAGYNGIVSNSSNSTVASDISAQTSDLKSIISMGVHPSSSNLSIFQEYMAHQYGNVVVSTVGKEFTKADIGRSIYWTSTDRTDTITGFTSNIAGLQDSLNANDTSNVIISGTYSADTTKSYLLQVDGTGTPNTFRWSNDGGQTFKARFVRITDTSTPISLDNGLSATFTNNSTLTLHQQFTFDSKKAVFVSNTNSIATPEKLYTLQPYHSYLKTETETDLVISTNSVEKMRITGDGSVGIQTSVPTACLELDSNYGRVLQVNDTSSNYQINPNVAHLQGGGYVTVWESNTTDGSSYGVYAQKYTTDGNKSGNNFKVNVLTTNNQSFPDVVGRNVANSTDYAVVWSDNSSGTSNYDIYMQIFKNNTALLAYDLLINNETQSGDSSRNNDQLYPKTASLTNGNYVVVWASNDANDGEMNIYGKIVDNSGNLVSSKLSINSTTTRSQNFPVVCALDSKDPHAPGGFVVAFLTELSTDINTFVVKFRVFNSDGTAAGSEVEVTTTTDASVSSISDGLLSIDGIEGGGFVLSFYRNYESDTSLYNQSDNITALTSGTTAVISVGGLNNTNNTITVQSVTRRFLIGEEIQIASSVAGVGNVVEKVKSVTYPTASTAVITLDTGYKQISAYSFPSNSTDNGDSNWISKVNTSDLYEDRERINLSNAPKNRDDSIFNYKRPVANIATSDNNTAIVSWTNGSIPSIYYQIINTITGALIGNETQIGIQYHGTKQRNPAVAALHSIQNQNLGYVVLWDNQSIDYSLTGIFQELVGYNHHILELKDGDTQMNLNHDGKLSLGTTSPQGTLHIKSNTPKINGTFNETSSLVLQNTATNYLTNEDQQRIQFMNGNQSVLGQIKASHSTGYDDLNPAADNLIGFYKFDHSSGTQVLDSSSENTVSASVTTNAILVNFDIENCWQPGLVNNCLAFDGIDDHVFIHDDASNNINSFLGSSSATFSVWVKVSTQVATSTTYDIISNYDDASAITDISGLYIISLVDTGADGNLKLRTQVRSASATGTATGSVTINDNSWKLITITILRDSSGTTNTITQYVNGSADGTDNFSGTISSGSGLIDQTVFIGAKSSSGSFFRGMMDELRIYNTVLSTDQISHIYKYGNQERGCLILNSKDATSTFKDSKSVILDDEGHMNNVSLKPTKFSILTGTLTGTNASTTINGNGTLFTSELKQGDNIRFDSADYPIVSIESDTVLTLNQIPTSSASKSEQSVMRKPNIISGINRDDELKMFMDNNGNLMLGTHITESKLGIAGTGGTNDLPYITLTNTTAENTDGGRESQILFKGNLSGSYFDLGKIDVSHSGTGTDKKGKMRFYTHNGTNIDNPDLVITDNGRIGIGNQTNPLGELHIRNASTSSSVIIQSGSTSSDVFSEQSIIYFAGENSINESTSSLNANCIVSIQGSGNSTNKDFDGRFDILTNNESRDNGLEKRLSVIHTGNVGVSIHQPINCFQASPEFRKTNYVTSTISSTSGQTITLSDALFDTDDKQARLLGGTVVIVNSELTTHKITAFPASNQVTLEGDISGNNTKTVHIHYPGINIKENGLTGIGETNPQSTLHVGGSLTLPITTLSSDTTIGIQHYTIICDSSGGVKTITLPSNSNLLTGRVYIVKRVGSNNVVVATNDSATIDGASTQTLSSNYERITVQSDGTNWHIIN